MAEVTIEKYYACWLQSLPDFAGKTIEKIRQRFPNPEMLFAVTEKELGEGLTAYQQGALAEAVRICENVEGMKLKYDNLRRRGIEFVSREEGEYPKRLLAIPDAPLGIFYRGRLPEQNRPAVAIIGARDCSEYGIYIAKSLGQYLGERGIDVISGMARGIDGISQQAAVWAGGSSFGVLGSGVDVCYPASNRELYNKLLMCGGILSTYPPGTKPLARNFPPRNRIVSGLADALVVVEARLQSGTLITVDMALEQGKEVYVVPGRITDRLSDGCNKLLKQGAAVFVNPQSFVEELNELWFLKEMQPIPKKKIAQEQNGKNEKQLSDTLCEILQLLSFEPRSIEELMEALCGKYTISKLSIYLMELVLKGYAKQVSAGCFSKVV